MTNFTSRQVLARLGLERRPSNTRTALTFGSVLGLGAALGAGALWAARSERLQRFIKRTPKTDPVREPTRPVSMAPRHAAGA